MEQRERLRDLVASWEDDSLTQAESDELAAMLEADPAARRALVDEFMVTESCARLCGGPAAGVRQRARRRPLGIATAIAAAAAAVALVAVWYGTAVRDERAVVARISALDEAEPDARIVPAVGTARVARAGAALRAGDRIEAGGCRVTIAYAPEATVVHLRAGAVASLEDERGAKRIVLERGRIDADVAPQPADRPLTVRTPQAEVTVVGTTLTVECGSGQTYVAVGSGRVRLVRICDGALVDVGSGQSATAAAGVALKVVATAATPPVEGRSDAASLQRSVVVTSYPSFQQYQLYANVAGNVDTYLGREALSLTFGWQSEDWHGGAWLPAKVPDDVAPDRCTAIAFEFCGEGRRPSEAYVTLLIGGANYQSPNLAAMFLGTEWRRIVLRADAFVLDRTYAREHPDAAAPAQPLLHGVSRIDICCIGPLMREQMNGHFGPFELVVGDCIETSTEGANP